MYLSMPGLKLNHASKRGHNSRQGDQFVFCGMVVQAKIGSREAQYNVI